MQAIAQMQMLRGTPLTLRSHAPLRRGLSTRTVAMAAKKTVISTDKAPAALGPYSQAIKAGNTLYCSGCIGLVPETMKFADDTVETQTEQVMKNMGEILKAAGADWSDVVKTTILLADIADFGKVNPIYGKYFPENPPARATFAVRDLPIGARVEIDCIAVLDE
jgi:reactive intermediate/imine deaminase